MDKRSVIGCVFSILLMTSLHAQTSIGVEGGLSNNSYFTNVANRASTVLNPVTGFGINLAFRYRICSWLYATAAPGIVQKGYSMNRTDSLYGVYDRHLNTYLQLPVAISLVYDWRRLRGTLDPGLYVGYWLSGWVRGSTANIFSVTDNTTAGGQATEQFQLSAYNGRYAFLSRRDERWEWGWHLGLGVEYRLSGPWRITASGKYYQALNSPEKASVSPIPAYNRTRVLSIGVARTLGRSKGGGGAGRGGGTGQGG